MTLLRGTYELNSLMLLQHKNQTMKIIIHVVLHFEQFP